MKDDFKLNKVHFIIFLVAALIIVIGYNIIHEFYYGVFVLPFVIAIIVYLYVFKDEKYLNKKAYYLLIPIVLILLSSVITPIDDSNLVINVFVLPILISVFLILLTNKNYSIKGFIPLWIFKLFPKRLFSNLKYIKFDGNKKINTKKISKVFAGILIGGGIGIILLVLLTSGDIYFSSFIDKLFNLEILSKLIIDPFNIIEYFIWFLLIYSVYVNVIKFKNDKMVESKKEMVDKTIVSTILCIVNFIFLLFLVSEISKLTSNFLHLPVKYTYAKYAREGFFQLLFVTIINFIMMVYFIYKTDILKESKIVKWLLIVLSGFSIILIFNSYYRMFLYISHYGFTVLRLQVILFLLMELILFIMLIVKIIKGLNKDAFKMFIIAVTFYILNLYLCNNWFINLLPKIKR